MMWQLERDSASVAVHTASVAVHTASATSPSEPNPMSRRDRWLAWRFHRQVVSIEWFIGFTEGFTEGDGEGKQVRIVKQNK